MPEARVISPNSTEEDAQFEAILPLGFAVARAGVATAAG